MDRRQTLKLEERGTSYKGELSSCIRGRRGLVAEGREEVKGGRTAGLAEIEMTKSGGKSSGEGA